MRCFQSYLFRGHSYLWSFFQQTFQLKFKVRLSSRKPTILARVQVRKSVLIFYIAHKTSSRHWSLRIPTLIYTGNLLHARVSCVYVFYTRVWRIVLVIATVSVLSIHLPQCIAVTCGTIVFFSHFTNRFYLMQCIVSLLSNTFLPTFIPADCVYKIYHFSFVSVNFHWSRYWIGPKCLESLKFVLG